MTKLTRRTLLAGSAAAAVAGRTEPAGPGDQAATAQLAVRGSNGGGADAAMRGQRPDRRQACARGELAFADAALHAFRDLGRPPTGDVITYRYVHCFVP